MEGGEGLLFADSDEDAVESSCRGIEDLEVVETLASDSGGDLGRLDVGSETELALV